MATLTVRIENTSPLLMQAETLANPLHPKTKAHKAVSGKRKKTDDDYNWLMRSEWEASLYFDSEVGPYLPPLNIEASVIGGGKLHKLGQSIKRAVLVTSDKPKLEYEGPRTIEKMWDDGRFIDVRGVNIGGKKVMRCRPIFLKWAATFDVEYMEDIIDKADVLRCISDAGRLVGIGTYRPRFGRFTVVSAK